MNLIEDIVVERIGFRDRMDLGAAKAILYFARYVARAHSLAGRPIGPCTPGPAPLGLAYNYKYGAARRKLQVL